MNDTPPAADDFPPEVRARVEMTVGCRDCDGLPKVADAGAIVERDGERWQVMHNGLRVPAGGYHGDWMIEVIRRLRGHHEPQEELLFAEVLTHCAPGSTMVELGAFWSYYAAWFASTIPGGRAVLLEADEPSLAVGRATFTGNGLDGDFHLAVVGATPAPAVDFVRESDGAHVRIPRHSVASLAESAGVERIELLLADVQGAELEALEGSAALVAAGRLRFCVVSTHHHSISGDPLTHQRCLAWIREHGGHIIAEHSVAESFSGDGLIVASFAGEDRDIAPVSMSRNRACDSQFGEAEYDLAVAWDRLSGEGAG